MLSTAKELPDDKTHPSADNRHLRSDLGAMGAKAQEDSDDSAMTMQQNPGDEDDSGVMGHGTMRRCMRQCLAEGGMMGHGSGKHGMIGHGGMMRPFAMRMIFALMDRDGDPLPSLS
jgi:hypothetical protein